MNDQHQLDKLLEHYTLAKSSLPKIRSLDNGYFDYPKEVNDFMMLLTEEPWVKYDYKPAEVSATLQSIDSANFDQIRAVLTRVQRHERFYNGAWLEYLESGELEPLFERLQALIEAQ